MEEHETKKALYEVRTSGEFGRYLVASREIEARSLIIVECPVVCGPADDDQDILLGEAPMCLGCFARMTLNPWSRCTKCFWPVCGLKCEQMETHAENECKLFVSNGTSYPPRHTWPIVNKSILVLRCLLLREKSAADWEEVICRLEHHTERRHTKSYCVKGDEMLLDNLTDFLNDCGYELEEEIIRVSGVININAFSTSNLNSSEDPHSNQTMVAQCIFRNASLLAHSCVPNATWRIGPSRNSPSKLEITIRSTVGIKKGEMITIAYSSHENLYGTLQRQISNEDVAHFICNCQRCKDPTELGTFISAIKCVYCEEDFRYMLPENPLDPDSPWTCVNCSGRQSVQQVVLEVYNIQQKYEAIKREEYPREKEVEKLHKLLAVANNLHPNHYILQEIRLRIIKRQILALVCLDKKELDKLIEHSQFLLNITNILAPGFSQIRSLLQYFLAEGLTRKVNSEWFDAENKEEVQSVYKWIYSLQSRALLFFKSHNNKQNDNLTASIQKQLAKLTQHIQ